MAHKAFKFSSAVSAERAYANRFCSLSRFKLSQRPAEKDSMKRLPKKEETGKKSGNTAALKRQREVFPLCTYVYGYETNLSIHALVNFYCFAPLRIQGKLFTYKDRPFRMLSREITHLKSPTLCFAGFALFFAVESKNELSFAVSSRTDSLITVFQSAILTPQLFLCWSLL